MVATGSLRRRAQIAHARPDLRFEGLRGNMATRVARAGTDGVAAVVVAAAALDRLAWGDRIAERLAVDVVLPQVGQAALAVECRADDAGVRTALAAIEDGPSRRAVDAERGFLAELGGDCSLPAAAYAVVAGPGADAALTVRGLLATVDGATVVRHEVSGAAGDGEVLGVPSPATCWTIRAAPPCSAVRDRSSGGCRAGRPRPAHRAGPRRAAARRRRRLRPPVAGVPARPGAGPSRAHRRGQGARPRPPGPGGHQRPARRAGPHGRRGRAPQGRRPVRLRPRGRGGGRPGRRRRAVRGGAGHHVRHRGARLRRHPRHAAALVDERHHRHRPRGAGRRRGRDGRLGRRGPGRRHHRRAHGRGPHRAHRRRADGGRPLARDTRSPPCSGARGPSSARCGPRSARSGRPISARPRPSWWATSPPATWAGSRAGRCSGGASWSRGRGSRRARWSSGSPPSARRRSRCRPSPSGRPPTAAPPWRRRSSGWPAGATTGWWSPRPTAPSGCWPPCGTPGGTRGPSVARASPPSDRARPSRWLGRTSCPTSCPSGSSPRRCSTPSRPRGPTGGRCCSPAPRWRATCCPRGWRPGAGPSTWSRPTAPSRCHSTRRAGRPWRAPRS